MKSVAKPKIFRLISIKIRQGLYILASFGGELGIRTLGPVRDTAFRVLHHRPLGQLSIYINRLPGRFCDSKIHVVFGAKFAWNVVEITVSTMFQKRF